MENENEKMTNATPPVVGQQAQTIPQPSAPTVPQTEQKPIAQPPAVPTSEQKPPTVQNLLDKKMATTDNAKDAIDILATAEALKREDTAEKLVSHKKSELEADAVTKVARAETQKVQAETDKQVAELDKQIITKKKEVERIKADSDKADQFFEGNKELLRYVGCRTKKTIGTMRFLIVPALIIFLIVQILLLPITFCGLVIENIVRVVGDVCGAIKQNGWKIVASIFIVLLIAAVIVAVYFYGGKLIGLIGGGE